MLDRLSEQAMQTVIFAEQEMRRTGYAAIVPIHLLLGFLAQGDNPVASILERSGATVDALRVIVDGLIGARAEQTPKDINLTDETQTIIAIANEIASYSGVFYVQPEHLFVAMLRIRDNAVTKCWGDIGVDLRDAEATALRVIDDLDEELADDQFGAGAAANEKTRIGGKFDQAKAAAQAEKARLAVHEAAQRRGSKNSDTWHKWQLAADEFHRTIDAAYPPGFWENFMRLKEGQPQALDMAIVFLENDPWFFRTGYIKVELIKYIGRTTLTDDSAQRLRRVLVNAVDGRDRREFRAYCRLARKVDNANLRAELLARIHSSDEGIRRRAKWLLEALGVSRITCG